MFFGGELSLKKILFTFLFVVSSVVNAEVNTSVDVSGKNDSKKEENKLPDVDLEKYKDELLSYQELQRKNMMLKLQSENQKLESEIKKSGAFTSYDTNENTIYLMSIMTTPKKGLCATIFNGSISRVCKGDIINEHSVVSDITGNYVEIRSINDISDPAQKIFLR
ncbi:bundle-forming pilus protein BfpU [Escherichia coli]|nr:bundle-forming pilus protein BfpU [Escherichia coli]EFJ5343356.1 bundle-forming pilus protein BfpU [Escherichia coli]HEI3997892.1 bundle-forming pilus protein BfpU [Escherichia coli]